MATVREIFVRLGVRTDPRGFKRAEAGISRITNSAMLLGRVFVTGAVAIGLKRMIGVASDIEETANKFSAVFGEAGANVQRNLDAIAERTGATNLQLQEMSSNIGALIKPALGSARAAGQMATGVSELALDIASFNNVTSDEALIALRSGLIGSAEPLQRFGVDVRVAALEQEALRQGITQSIKDMTEGQRVALRYASIQRQLGAQGATGDATRTAEGFANASRNLGQAIRETAGIIGTFFLGSVGGMVNSIRDAVDSFQSWLKTNRAVIQQGIDRFFDRTGRVLRSLVSFTRLIIDGTKGWLDSLNPVTAAIIKTTAAIAALAAIMMLPGVPLLLLITLIGLLIDDFETWRAGGDSIIGDMTRGIEGLVEEWGGVGPAIGAMLDTALRHWMVYFGATEAQTDDWIQALDETLQNFWVNIFDYWGSQIAQLWNDLFVISDESLDTWGLALIETLQNFWPNVLDFWGQQIKDFFTGLVRLVLPEFVRDAAAVLGGLVGDVAAKVGIDIGEAEAVTAPGVATAPAAVAGTQTNVSRTMNVTNNITAQPGQSIEEIGRAVVEETRKLMDREYRAVQRDVAVEAAGG